MFLNTCAHSLIPNWTRHRGHIPMQAPVSGSDVTGGRNPGCAGPLGRIFMSYEDDTGFR
jgi:hypothetical protein